MRDRERERERNEETEKHSKRERETKRLIETERVCAVLSYVMINVQRIVSVSVVRMK